jgi:hypothetical protein
VEIEQNFFDFRHYAQLLEKSNTAAMEAVAQTTHKQEEISATVSNSCFSQGGHLETSASIRGTTSNFDKL